ncbi:MAG: YggS family pyridoxal phosphate-dependent enzyme [Mycobacterium sp.]
MSEPDRNEPAREIELMTALARVRQRLADAAESVGRRPGEVELLAVTKFFPASDVAMLYRLGHRAFGEAREQEAARKVAEVRELTGAQAPITGERPIAWHMIGQIQRNKAKSIVAWADTVHSVSSERVITALDRARSAVLDKGVRTEPLGVYVQVSLDGDTERGGVDVGDPAAIDALCDQVAVAPALRLLGVMGVPPLEADPDEAFARLAAEHRRVLRGHPEATGLSAGMSSDLEIAVKHGSTCVRVGTALLGRRPLTSP